MGLHKTGTTTVQEFFRVNKDRLAGVDVLNRADGSTKFITNIIQRYITQIKKDKISFIGYMKSICSILPIRRHGASSAIMKYVLDDKFVNP